MILVTLKKTAIIFFLLFAIIALINEKVYAAFPGQCVVLVYVQGNYYPNNGGYASFNYTDGGSNLNAYSVTYSSIENNITSAATAFYIYYKNDSNEWELARQLTNYINAKQGISLPGTKVSAASPAAVTAALGTTCPVECSPKSGHPIYDETEGYPVLTGLPYHAAYYQTVGVCIDHCRAKPVGPVILDQYASDNSGYTVAPFHFDGASCTETTAQPPPQPDDQKKCENIQNACESKCAGRAYTFNCESGSCECFGAPSYNSDPPLEPTEPETDPGSPTLPPNQTASSDPGGDAQLGAQISNQGKQIDQGNAQLGQLGAVNAKLGAVIGNQAKQLNQGDKIIDYNRQQLGVLKDIRDELKEQNSPGNPGVPGAIDYDGTVGDAKNWTEYDDPEQVGQARATREQALQNSTPELPLSFRLQASGSPALSGQMFGRQVEIRFDRPWMETGYSLMQVLLIGIGYLQVFLMVNRTILNDR